MSDNDKSKPKQDITRRTTLTLAATVAAFGAAMGMRTSPAHAKETKLGIKQQGKTSNKVQGKSSIKTQGKADYKEQGKTDIKGQGKSNLPK